MLLLSPPLARILLSNTNMLPSFHLFIEDPRSVSSFFIPFLANTIPTIAFRVVKYFR